MTENFKEQDILEEAIPAENDSRLKLRTSTNNSYGGKRNYRTSNAPAQNHDRNRRNQSGSRNNYYGKDKNYENINQNFSGNGNSNGSLEENSYEQAPINSFTENTQQQVPTYKKEELPQDDAFEQNQTQGAVSENTIYVQDLRTLPDKDLFQFAEEAGIENPQAILKQDLIFALLKKMSMMEGNIVAEGILETLQDGFGFLRSKESNYRAGPDDIYVSPNQIKRFSLKNGDKVEGQIRSPRTNERYFALSHVSKINNDELKKAQKRVNFDNLTPLYPDSRIKMELNDKSSQNLSSRIIDMVAPIGKGQRALIVAPPRSGKTMLLQTIAKAIEKNHPEVTLLVLLIDERPEEVTDMQRTVKGEVVSSTFDEPATRHVQLADILIEKAKRLVEHGKDVVILLDSITRLARAYNAVAPSSGKVLTGGVDANALQKPKRFFGAARNIEDGGSLTIIATALIETGSRMDEVIFEEFKGTGNSEIVLDRKLADKRVFPAIDILKSGTRHEEQLYEKGEMQKIWVLRKILSQMSNVDAMEFLVGKIEASKTNEDFFSIMNK